MFKIKFLLITFVLMLTSIVAQARPGRIALVQYNADLHFNQYAINMSALTDFANDAVANKADIIVFPEGSAYGYADKNNFWCANVKSDSDCVDVRNAAEAIPGGRTEHYWSEFAKINKIYVLYNLPELGRDGKFYNTTGVAGPQGYVTKYRKQQLYATDTYYASAGKTPTILQTEFGNFGLAICMDATYRGVLEKYKALDVDAVILNMDWDDDPNGFMAAKKFFPDRAHQVGLDIFISDVSAWDGTGKYSKTGSPRERSGLAPDAIDIDGISYSEINFRD